MTETRKKTPLEVFLARSGYEEKDVLAWSAQTLTFVTSNGGKYQLSRSGAIRKIMGPDYPKFVPPTPTE